MALPPGVTMPPLATVMPPVLPVPVNVAPLATLTLLTRLPATSSVPAATVGADRYRCRHRYRVSDAGTGLDQLTRLGAVADAATKRGGQPTAHVDRGIAGQGDVIGQGERVGEADGRELGHGQRAGTDAPRRCPAAACRWSGWCRRRSC